MTITAPGTSYELIGSLTAQELTTLIAEQLPYYNFPIPQTLATPTISSGATFYRVCYTIDVNNPNYPRQQVVSGLLMVPDRVEGQEMPGKMPLALYSHGTLFNRDSTSSNVVFREPDGGWAVGSFQTLLTGALLADKGYSMIAADYVGFGVNNIQQAYAVKKPTTEAIVGFLEASRSVLSGLGIQPSQLFLTGQSQGGANTQWSLQALEALQIPVAAVAAETPFNEFEKSFRWWISRQMMDPKEPLDPGAWIPLCVGILLRSHESWEGLSGLFDAIVKDAVIPAAISSIGEVIRNPLDVTYREVIKRFAEFGDAVVRIGPPSVFSNDAWQVNVIRDGREVWTTTPGFTGAEMLVDGALDRPVGVVRQFLEEIKANSPRYWTYSTPLKAWYGLEDEALPPELVDPGLAEAGGPKVTLVPVDGASHDQAFLNALLASKDHPAGTDQNLIDWFQSFRKNAPTPPALVLNGDSLQVVSEDFGLLTVLLQATKQEGERPMHIEILRTRKDGRSEVIGSIGGTTAEASQLQSLGRESVLLQVGETLEFRLLSRSGDGRDSVSTEIRAVGDTGNFEVLLRTDDGSQPASLQFNVIADPVGTTPSALDQIAAPQASATDGLLQLREGQRVELSVSTDCAFENRLGFVRLNVDSVTGLPLGTVGDQKIAINSDLFREQIDFLLDPGFQIRQTGRTISSDLFWDVKQDGLFSPVLITQEGNVFCSGPADAADGDNPQMRLLGKNHLGFEDLKGVHSDYDWNDLSVHIVSVS